MVSFAPTNPNPNPNPNPTNRNPNPNPKDLSSVLGGGPPIVSDLYFIFPTRGLVTVDD